jgi:ATP adenylyltransferase
MEILYAPWRMNYASDAEQGKRKSGECIFCEYVARALDDETNYVLARTNNNLCILNLHPYNGGHVLVVPFKHGNSVNLLTVEERAEFFELTNTAMEVLREAMEPHGFNIGMNIGGKAAGGSIPEHLHMHIIPRWQGDTSFLPLTADTKPVSQNLQDVYNKLKEVFKKKI